MCYSKEMKKICFSLALVGWQPIIVHATDDARTTTTVHRLLLDYVVPEGVVGHVEHHRKKARRYAEDELKIGLGSPGP